MTTNAYRPTSDLVQEQRSTRPPTDEKEARWKTGPVVILTTIMEPHEG